MNRAMNRYLRQVSVPQYGPEAQAAIRAARITVVGVGGLAAPVLQYLAGAGVGHLRLVDPDTVELGNLHRQTLFREQDVGRPKVHAAAAAVAALNSEVGVEPVEVALGPDNAACLVSCADVVLDCADSFAVSYVLSDLCLAEGLPLVSASATGLEGYAGVFCGGGPSLRAVFPELPRRLGSCAEDGVIGPVLGVIGALQAQMALDLVARPSAAPLARLVSFDGGSYRFGGFSFAGAPEPPLAPGFIAADAVGADDLVVDLRGEDEGPLLRPDARRIPASEAATLRPADGQRVVMVCRTGMRAWDAAERLGAVWPGKIALLAVGR